MKKSMLGLITLAMLCLMACNQNPPEEEKPTFEEQFWKKWECWKTAIAGTERELGEDASYMTFLEDGKLLLEQADDDEVQIYKWRKRSDKEVTILIPTPASDLEGLEMLSLIGVEASSFRDTLTIDATVNELTDTTLVMEGLVSIRDMLTDEGIERFSKVPALKEMLNSSIRCILYLRRELPVIKTEEKK